MEFSIVSIAVERLWNYTVMPIAKQAGYLIFYRSNIRELKKEVEELQLAKERVQLEVDAAQRNGEEIERDVQNWLQKVDEISWEYEKLNNDECHTSAGCSSRSFPNIYYRHKLSKQSKKMKEAMIETKLGGKFDQVSFKVVPKFAPRISTISLAPEDPNVQRQLESRVLIQNDITNALKDPMIHTIGVYGLGGVGKTTLVKAIAEKAQQDKHFDVVAFANVTHTPNLENIQKEIAGRLGLKYENESFSIKATRLRDRLLNVKYERVLIILDDLWEEFKMDDIGIPSTHNGLKIIMTSRNQELLSNQMNTQRNFFLDVLTKEDAWKLFKEKTQLNESTVSDEVRAIATQVFEECGCLPIAIVTIASALKKKDLFQWTNALRTLKDPAQRTISDMQDKIFKLMNVSYDKLENDLLRSIFLLCGVMQQDSLVTNLFNISFGLGLFEEIDNLEDARNSLYTCICKLKDSCLLLEGDSGEHFSMHDVVHDAAIFLASRQQHLFIKRCKRLKEWPEGDQLTNCRTIIIDHCDFDELSEGLHCPSLTFFHLNNRTESLEIADRFFEGMPKLRVLNLEGEKLNSLPSSLRHLSNLRTLHLNLDVSGDLRIIGELKSLRVLTLNSVTVRQLPIELSQLTRLQLLDLRKCYNLVVIPPNLLLRLTELEELYFPNYSYSNNIQWNVHVKEVFYGASNPRNQPSKASLAELNDLACLTTLEVCIQDVNMLPKELVFERLKSYKIIIGSNYDWSSRNGTSKILQLEVNTSSHSWHNLKRLLYSVEYLYLLNLKGAENVLPSTNEEGMLKLKYLQLQLNDEIQTIVDSSAWDLAVDIFPNLESLVINYCGNLEEICNGYLTGRSLSRLKDISVRNCGKMKSLFSLSRNENATRMLHLSELQSLLLNSLPKLISFLHEDKKDSGENIDTPIALFNDKVMLPNLEEIIIRGVNKLNTLWHWEQQLCPKSFDKLRKLEITDNPKLVIIFPSHIGVSLHSLETLLIANCKSLEHVFDVQGVYAKETHSEISHLSTGVVCFPNLQQVHVEECERLKYLFPASVAKTLNKLQSLEIDECFTIEEIIIKDENNNTSSCEKKNGDKDHAITFSKLKFLKLQQLSSLESFSSENFIFKFPLLQEFIVINCTNMITFSEGMPSTPSLQSVQIGYHGNVSYWEGNLNATIQKIYTDNIGFRRIWLSELTKFPQLKKLWQGHVSTGFKHLTFLGVYKCDFDSNVIIPFNVLKSLINLEEIQIYGCESVEAVFDLEGINNQETNVTLETRLRTLELRSLPDLKHVWNGDGKEIVTFQNLQTVTAILCEQLRSVFPAHIAKGLTQLKVFSIKYCGVEEIVAKEEGQAMCLSIMFPELIYLAIENVPNIKCFYPGDYTVEFPKLSELSLGILNEVGGFLTQLLKVMPPMDKLSMHWQQEVCPKSFDKLKKLYINTCSELVTMFRSHIGSSLQNLEELLITNCESLEYIFDVQGVYARETHSQISCLPTRVLCFPNLQQVYITGCKRLKYLFPASMAKTLEKLQSLKIEDCSMIEEIIIKEENNNPSSNEVIVHGDGDYEIIIFSKLTFLELHDLPRLRSFSSGNFIFEFPLLEDVTVSNCTMLRTFSEGIASTPNLEDVQIKYEESYWEGNLNATIQMIYQQMVGFNDIELSNLTEFPLLEELWQGQVSKEFKYLTSLVVDGCEFDSNVIIPFNVLKSLINLTKLTIQNCNSVGAVFDLEGINNQKTNVTLETHLRTLELWSLPDLKHVWKGDGKEIVTFQNLQTVTARHCEQLTSVFPANIAKGLTQLKDLIIQDCGIEEIVAMEEEQAMFLSFMFPKLTNLNIQSVPNLRCFYSGDYAVECPRLRELILHIQSEAEC